MKDYAKRNWLLGEQDQHKYQDKNTILGKVAFACLASMILIALLAVYIPTAKAGDLVSCDSLVDAKGEE